MARWEYMQIFQWRIWEKVYEDLEKFTWSDPIIKTKLFNSDEKETTYPDDTSSIKVLNDLGTYGWELVTIEFRNGMVRDYPAMTKTGLWVERRFYLKRERD